MAGRRIRHNLKNLSATIHRCQTIVYSGCFESQAPQNTAEAGVSWSPSYGKMIELYTIDLEKAFYPELELKLNDLVDCQQRALPTFNWLNLKKFSQYGLKHLNLNKGGEEAYFSLAELTIEYIRQITNSWRVSAGFC